MPAKNKRSPRWAYGVNSIVSTVIFLAILVVIVLIAERKPLRMDLTETRSFSLSGQTRNILNQVDKPIEVKVFISAAGPSAQNKDKIKDLLDTYCYYNKNIKYEFIDPDTQPEITRRYEIKTYGTIVLEGYDKKQAVQTADEENITNALLKLTRKEQKKVYFLIGHGEHSFSSEARDSYSNAKAALEKNSYAIAEFNLLQQVDIPADAAAVIIAGPQKQIPEREQQVVKNFLARGGKVMLMIDPLTNTGMNDFLKGYGIEIGQDVVIDRLSRLFGASERVPVIMEYGNHKITENFSQPTFFPDSRSVFPSEKPPEGVDLLVLASTSPNAWAERNLAMLQEGKAVFDKNMDVPGPVPLVVLATIAGQQKKPDAGQKEENDHGKDGILVVAGNSQFVSNPYFNQYGNGDFFLNTVNFLADEANLITFERPNTHKPLLLTSSQRMTILWIVIIVPLAVLVSGIAAYRVRRSQR
ncbi:MAG: GldG family protein [Syntrophobacteraceae bacterium]